jgi:hypothetical protein
LTFVFKTKNDLLKLFLQIFNYRVDSSIFALPTQQTCIN